MGKTTFYRQCYLEKPTTEGTSCQMSWIPEKFAVKDKVLKLKDDDGNWDNGWIVRTVGTFRREDEDLPDSHSAIKGHRKTTGDSMPKTKPRFGKWPG